MADKTPMRPELWTERTVDETIGVYRDWAQSYDRDVTARGYHTPRRLAEALAPFLPPDDRPVLDFGCGTGISGAALRAASITPVHGTDITAEMVDIARTREIYARLWVGAPGAVPASPGTYRAIAAAGVVSLGAAPPETLDDLVAALAADTVLALSFNDPTLADGRFDAALQAHVDAGRLEILTRQHGPHLDDMNMGSDVIVARRR